MLTVVPTVLTYLFIYIYLFLHSTNLWKENLLDTEQVTNVYCGMNQLNINSRPNNAQIKGQFATYTIMVIQHYKSWPPRCI